MEGAGGEEEEETGNGTLKRFFKNFPFLDDHPPPKTLCPTILMCYSLSLETLFSWHI